MKVSVRVHTLLVALSILMVSGPGLAIGAPLPRASGTDIAKAQPRPSGTAPDNASYALCGRVYSDPHAYWDPAGADVQLPGRSPWAKGNKACEANDFLTYQDMIDGSTYLEQLIPNFFEFYELEKDFGDGDDCSISTSNLDYCSAGLPRQGVSQSRERSDLYMIRVTDERVSNAGKKYFVFPLSIHGIERAGAEAGVRAAEDLATWGYCQAVAAGQTVTAPRGDAQGATIDCAKEGAIPHPMLETQPLDPATNVNAGFALRNSVIYFVFANPDGWRRGDHDNPPRFFQRYNGNGVDMNRDWPTKGFTFRPYTPWSEPETRSFGKVLERIGPKDANGRPKWAGGIDLHGQLIDRAFSFTLLGASERNYTKNQRILQSVKGAWADAEERLSWSPLIVPNDEERPTEAHMYGVQWGTIWDTIDYTVTGSLGDWIDSPLGLNGDGIDNEMSLSHLGNCGIGSCYIKDAEQLHVDGNKSLIYSMVNFTLLPEDNRFRAPGKIAYVYNPRVIRHAGSTTTQPPAGGLQPQPAIMDQQLSLANDYRYEFEIRGPNQGFYNGGVEGKMTSPNVSGVSPGSLTSLVLERYRPEEDPVQGGEGCGDSGGQWEEVNRYFNQDSVYLQGGQAVHSNLPTPGRWRICLTGSLEERLASNGLSADLDITFSTEKAWENPGQLPYRVTNMKFFTDLARNMRADQLVRVNVDDILDGRVNLDQFTSLVIADEALPGYSERPPTGTAQPDQRIEGVEMLAATATTVPCAGDADSPPSCTADFEFDVLATANNQKLTVILDTPAQAASDWDLYVQRRNDAGTYTTVGQSATGSGDESATLLQPLPGHYRARLVSWAGTTKPSSLDILFDDTFSGPPVYPSTRTAAERDAWGAALARYVRRGGNLVLTDGGMRNLAYMGLVPRRAVRYFTAYAGYIGFTTDGTDETYDDPLARNVDQPGAAEGEGHRHQTYEPVPIGFAIQDEQGNDFNTSPVWGVDQTVWEEAGGRTAGTTTARQVTLGELKLGNGVIRVIGPLLPMPTNRYYHPFGLANYALTYTGYQVLNNALQWDRPVPAVPSLGINDVTITEGDATRYATFTIRLSAAASEPVTVRFRTREGTATAPEDYTAKSGERTFAPGQTTARLQVAIRGENLRENTERFFVDLSGATSNATILDARGVGRIVDDDPDDPVVVLTKSGPATAAAGEVITYRLAYENLGPLPSRNARVTDQLPAEVSFYSASGNGTYNSDTRRVTWSVGTVDVGETGTVTLRVRIRGSTPSGTVVLNTATFTGDATYAAPASAQTVVK